MARRRREVEQRELGIMLLPDDEVVTQLDTLVEAWEQLQDAERDLRVFGSKTGPPEARAHLFNSTDDFMTFNQRRREYLQEREDLHRQRDNTAERFQESADVVQVLLPRDCTLVHRHMGSRYVIRNENNKLLVSSAGS